MVRYFDMVEDTFCGGVATFCLVGVCFLTEDIGVDGVCEIVV